MIFRQVDDILSGRKRKTRRVKKNTETCWRRSLFDNSCLAVAVNGRIKWQVGKSYAIVPKRGAAGIGRKIRLTAIRCERLHDITEEDAIEEGVASVEEYKALWESINGRTKGARWADNPEVWVLEFELVKA